ncbi:hypothetical protein E4T52_06034 [Aureobasidium sp. EXF-3400]|nr:hypothetical protein E4T51_05236 [Aureobasidium sp. EXF-12344]KAI4779009.1 hypothetical protein E4T52_06034 [Aureobasidium sp. EXF-3400]
MIKEYPDPELYRMLRASQGRITKEFYASLQAEPELFLRFREQKSVTESKHYATDAKYRAARIKKAKAWNEAHKHDEDFTRRQKIYNWCFRRESFKRHPWTKNLPWTTHRPVVYTDKVSHYCAGCGCHRLGYKAWWQSMEDPNSFLCHKHYANRGWSEIMPKGYEDVRTLEELRVRYEELNQK